MSKIQDYEEMMDEIYTEKDREEEFRQNRYDRLVRENEVLYKKINLLAGYLSISIGIITGLLGYIVI